LSRIFRIGCCRCSPLFRRVVVKLSSTVVELASRSQPIEHNPNAEATSEQHSPYLCLPPFKPSRRPSSTAAGFFTWVT